MQKYPVLKDLAAGCRVRRLGGGGWAVGEKRAISIVASGGGNYAKF